MFKVRCTSSVHGSTVVYHDNTDEVRVCVEIGLLWQMYDAIMLDERDEAAYDRRNMDSGRG